MTVKENFTFLFVKVESIGVGVQVRKDSAVLLLYGRFNSMELFEGPRS